MMLRPAMADHLRTKKPTDKKPLATHIESIRAVPCIPDENVLRSIPSEAADDPVVSIHRQGGEGEGPPDKRLSQDINPKLWSWLNNNCKTFAYVPLHRKDDHIKGYQGRKKRSKRRDINVPHIYPSPSHIAYRFRSCSNWNEKQVPTSRNILQDSDEYFIEALTKWHQERWFEVIGRGGRLDVLSPLDSTHLRVARDDVSPSTFDNAMEDDHMCSIVDKELVSLLKLAANDDKHERVTPFMDQVQEQRRVRNSKLQFEHRYKYEFKPQRNAMVGLSSYLHSLKPKYSGPPGCPYPEYWDEPLSAFIMIDQVRINNRHSAAVTIVHNRHETNFSHYELGDQTPYYHNRLRLMELGVYIRSDYPFQVIPKGVFSRLGSIRLAALRDRESTFDSGTKITVYQKLKQLCNSVAQFFKLNDIDDPPPCIEQIESKHDSPTVECCKEYFKVSCQWAPFSDSATPFLNNRILKAVHNGIVEVEEAKLSETAKAGTARSITESIVKKHVKLIPSSLDVDNLDLFKKREDAKKSFTKQIDIPPITHKDIGIITSNLEVIIPYARAQDEAAREVEWHWSDYKNIVQTFEVRPKKSTCPSCGKV